MHKRSLLFLVCFNLFSSDYQLVPYQPGKKIEQPKINLGKVLFGSFIGGVGLYRLYSDLKESQHRLKKDLADLQTKSRDLADKLERENLENRFHQQNFQELAQRHEMLQRASVTWMERYVHIDNLVKLHINSAGNQTQQPNT